MTIAISSAQPTNPPDPPDPGPGPSGVFFETAFANDAGWAGTNNGNWNEANKPKGWTASKMASDAVAFDIQGGQGRDSSPALRVIYSGTPAQSGANTLAWHMTGDQTTGYMDFYYQMVCRFDPDFLFSEGGAVWKLGRFWAHRSPTNDGKWSENAAGGIYGDEDTRYIVLNWAQSGTGNFFPQAVYNVELDNTNSSTSAGKRCRHRWRLREFYNAIPEWELQTSGGNQGRFVGYNSAGDPGTQGWHEIHWHLQYSTLGSQPPGNGVLEGWMDNTHYQTSDAGCELTQTNVTGYSDPYGCVVDNNIGMNFFMLLDNRQNINTTAAFWIDQVVLSTEPIPFGYRANSPT